MDMNKTCMQFNWSENKSQKLHVSENLTKSVQLININIFLQFNMSDFQCFWPCNNRGSSSKLSEKFAGQTYGGYLKFGLNNFTYNKECRCGAGEALYRWNQLFYIK